MEKSRTFFLGHIAQPCVAAVKVYVCHGMRLSLNYLQSDLDDVLDDLVGLLLALGELSARLVELVQDLTAGVVC